MQITTTHPQPEVAHSLDLVGRFDAFEVPSFDDIIASLPSETGQTIAVDLSQVEFIDSAALASLVRVMKRQREAGGDLILRKPSDPVRVIFELTKLNAAFTIED